MAESMSESDSNSTSSTSEVQQHSEESGNELELNIRRARPYQDEPVVNAEEDNMDDDNNSDEEDEEDEEDEDGIPAATLEARFENRVSVDTW